MFRVHTQRRALQVAQQGFDVTFRKRLTAGHANRVNGFSVGNELHGAHAIAPKLLEQAESVGSSGARTIGNHPPNLRAIGKRHDDASRLDALVFSGYRLPLRSVMVDGD